MVKALVVLLMAGAAMLYLTPFAPAQSITDQVGLSALQARLGGATPTGLGVEVMQVEANGGGGFRPDATDPQFAGKTFIDRTGGTGLSGHATLVGLKYYGLTDSVAPGITRINTYGVDGSLSPFDWLGTNYLNFGGGAPVVETVQRVQNHSYIFNGSFDPTIQAILRRYDFALRRDNVLGVVGVNNNVGGPMPAGLGNSYNSISVGLTNGGASFGPSTGDVPGRSKPDIVAPNAQFSSFSTPLVAGAGAVLIQTADGLGNANAGRIETLKATLLSGATKDEFAGLATPWNRVNNGSFVEPLDRRFGAGELNINNSHLILTAGEKNGTDLALDGHIGWDFETLQGAGATRTYFFDLNGVTNVQFSATVTWLRRIAPTGTGDLFATSDATLSLVEMRLFNANPDFSLGSLIDSSVSPIDNVQHLYRTDLAGTGRFALQVTLADLPGGQADENIGVAWFTTFSPVPEPGTFVIAGGGLLAVVTFQRRRRQVRGPKPGPTNCPA